MEEAPDLGVGFAFEAAVAEGQMQNAVSQLGRRGSCMHDERAGPPSALGFVGFGLALPPLPFLGASSSESLSLSITSVAMPLALGAAAAFGAGGITERTGGEGGISRSTSFSTHTSSHTM